MSMQPVTAQVVRKEQRTRTRNSRQRRNGGQWRQESWQPISLSEMSFVNNVIP